MFLISLDYLVLRREHKNLPLSALSLSLMGCLDRAIVQVTFNNIACLKKIAIEVLNPTERLLLATMQTDPHLKNLS